MDKDDFGCDLRIPAQGGDGQTVLYLVNVEREFLGLSLTEQIGSGMRRVAVELRDIGQITQLRNSLDAFLSQQGGSFLNPDKNPGA